MALTLSSDAQSVFFVKVFGQTHEVTQRVKHLIGVGVTFETGMYTVTAVWQGKENTVNLTKGTTALMKHEIELALQLQNKNLITEWVADLYLQVKPQNQPTVKMTGTIFTPQDNEVVATLTSTVPTVNKLLLIKAVMKVTELSLKDAKTLAENAIDGKHQYLKIYPNKAKGLLGILPIEDVGGVVTLTAKGQSTELHTTMYPPPIMKLEVEAIKVKPTNTVMHLKDAKALGQKVHGTSHGSVYHCIAVSEHVKVAARLYKTGGISIRTEWTDNPTAELKALKDAGVQMKGQYGSIHFDAADVPMPRVIGAFLMGTGIQWKQVVASGADLIFTEKS